jgi:hypothetical protein
MLAVLTAAILVLTIGAVSAFAFVPTAPYFSPSINFDSATPMGNATVFDIEGYTDPSDQQQYTLVFFQPERYYESHIQHDLIGVIDELWIIDPSDGTAYNTVVAGEGYAQINKDWLLQNGSIEYYEVDNIGVDIYDVTAQAFSRHTAINTVYFKVN